MLRSFILLLLLNIVGGTTFLCAQSSGSRNNFREVYPIRVDHKWGYMKVYEDTLLILRPPKYDYIGDVRLPWNNEKVLTSSPFKVFELNERVGLIDDELNEILPNNFKRIRPITANFFAAEIDSAFTLIDRAENPYLKGAVFDDIFLADAFPTSNLYYFFTKKEGKWGLYRLDGTELIPPQYAVMKEAGKAGYYKVKYSSEESQWRLIDTTGTLVLEEAYNEILVLERDFIAVHNGESWKLFLTDQPGIFPINQSNLMLEKYEAIEPLNKHMAVLVPTKIEGPADIQTTLIQLWSIPEKKPLTTKGLTSRSSRGYNRITGIPQFEYAPWYLRLDEERVAVRSRRGQVNQFKLIDSSGQFLADTSFQALVPAKKEGFYIVALQGRAGLLAPQFSPMPIVPCMFNRILPFEGDIAIAMKDGYFGAIGLSRAGSFDTLPFIYRFEDLTILGKREVQVDFRGIVLNYVLNEEGLFERQVVSTSGLTVSENLNKPFREAAGIEKDKMRKYQPFRWDDNRISFYLGIDSLAHILIRGSDGIDRVVGTVPRYFLQHTASQLLPGFVVSYYPKDETTYTVFTKNLLSGRINKMKFYIPESDTILPDLDIIGMRAFDHRYKYAAFLSKDGKVGLMDAFGKPLMKDSTIVKYSYIGPFIAGRARVALNGRLVFDEKLNLGQSTKFSVGSRNDFLREWNIKPKEKPGEFSGRNEIYVMPENDEPVRWGYIDETGNFLFEVDADHIADYNWKDSTAVILRKNGKVILNRFDADMGLIDYSGKEILPTAYNSIETYDNYHLVTVDSTPTIYFTKKGHQIFTNRTRLRPFSEGVSQFMNIDSLWGYVDTLGNVVIAPQYTLTRPFSEGLAMVVDSSGYCGFINKKGEKVFTTALTGKQWIVLGDFHNGRCWFKEKKGKRWGCYNKKGEVIIPPKFYNLPDPYQRKDSLNMMAVDFQNGLATVLIGGTGLDRKVGIIDTTGAFVVPPIAVYTIKAFNEYGVAAFQRKAKGRWGILNKKGEILLEPTYRFIDDFSAGHARVELTKGQWGMINSKGEQVIPARHVGIGKYSNGLVALRRKYTEDWFFVDNKYKVELAGPYFKAQDFKNGVTLITDRRGVSNIINTKGDTIIVEKGVPAFFSEGLIGAKDTTGKARFFYADVAGRNIYRRVFQEITPFKRGIASIRRLNSVGKKGEMLGAINRRGVMVVPPKFRNIHIQADGNVIINPQRFYGLVGKDGTLLIEPIFDKILEFDEYNLFRVEQGEKVGYVRLINGKAKWIWELQY